jgi:hypothetical protein
MPPSDDGTVRFALAAGVNARVAPGARGSLPVFCFIDAVSLAVPPSHLDYAFRRGTVGSSWETGDELRFDTPGGSLTSALFYVPELNGDCSLWYPVATMPARRRGVLAIDAIDALAAFSVPRTGVRVFDPDGAALICVSDSVSPHEIDGVLEVAQDFSILTAAEAYCGWRLQRPMAHLCLRKELIAPDTSAASTSTSTSSAAPARHLYRLFELVNDHTRDALEDRDDDLEQQLESLREEVIRLGEGPAPHAIRSRIEDLLEWSL